MTFTVWDVVIACVSAGVTATAVTLWMQRRRW